MLLQQPMSSSRALTTAVLLIPTFVLGSVIACGSAVDRSNEFGPDAASGGTSGTSGTSGSSGTSGFGSSGAPGDGGTSGDMTCAAAEAQTQKAKVDIIFVIDDSGSMTEEMTQIRTNVNTFATKIGTVGLDYTVTFIVRRGTNANQNQICVPAPLAGANCADNPPTFHHVNQDVQSTDSFQRILQTYDTSWKNYIRMEATKVFIEVTDDTSNMSETAFDTQLLAKQPAGMFGTAADRHYIWHSIVSKPFATTPPSSSICSTAAGPSVQYQNLSILTKGIIDEVCKTDYSGVLDNIAKGITDKLGCELGYPSTATSDPTKLAVTFTPKGQAAQTLTQVTDVSKCGTIADAWYYDNAASPTKIILCPSMCTKANAATDGKLAALVGCKGAPPK
ncbi:MAG: hypothetical protein QOI41_7492 [Myxococcales bacterium]|nr:hypothetical protein [Myxococcales bacterium]